MNAKALFLVLFVSLVFASSPTEKSGKAKKKKIYKTRRSTQILPSQPVIVRKAKTSNEYHVTATTTTTANTSPITTADYSSSSSYDSTKSNSGLTEEELDSFGFINFGNSEDSLINVEEDAPVDEEEKLDVILNGQIIQNDPQIYDNDSSMISKGEISISNENQTSDDFKTFTEAMAVSDDQQNTRFFKIPWDTEFEGQWCLGPVEFQQLFVASYFSLFDNFLNFPADTKIAAFDGNLRVDLNWPEMGPNAPVPEALSIRFQSLAVCTLVQDNQVEKFRKLVSDQVIDLERPIYESSADIYRSFLSFAIDRDNHNLDKIDLIIQFMPQHMINKADSTGVTPLEAAIIRNDLVLVKTLVESGADMNIKTDSSKNTPFLRAILSYNFKIVEYLIYTGKVDFFDDGHVLSLATIHLNSDLMQKALDFLSTPPNFKAIQFGKMLNHIFVNSPSAFKILVIEIVKLRKLKLIIYTSLLALLKDDFEMIKYLHSANVPMNHIMSSKHYFRYCFIHIVAARGQLEMFKLLLSFGINPRELTGAKKSILQVAYEANRFNIIEEILKMGVFPGLFDCLEHAFVIENLQMIHLLLNSSLNLNELIFPSGHNLITKAIEMDKPQIIDILIKSGKVNLYNPDKLFRTIYTISIPRNASESLKAIFEREVDSFNELLSGYL